MMVFDIAGLIGTIRHFGERKVRNLGKGLVEFVAGRLGIALKPRDVILEFRDLGHQRLGALLLVALLGSADLA